jgi:predicted lipoprotein with Yx(FWY)xxD motif
MHHLRKLSIPAIAVCSLALAACGSSSTGTTAGSATNTQPPGASATASVVKLATNPTYGRILVDDQGMTLYRLSGESPGKLICTSSACLGVWRPLTASAAGKPSGEVGALSTITRSNGTVQVTYQGSPLYTFAQDKHPGEANGQGLKDVGTWSVIKLSSGSRPSAHPAAPAATTPSRENYAY